MKQKSEPQSNDVEFSPEDIISYDISMAQIDINKTQLLLDALYATKYKETDQSTYSENHSFESVFTKAEKEILKRKFFQLIESF